jgi:hypothetical protein
MYKRVNRIVHNFSAARLVGSASGISIGLLIGVVARGQHELQWIGVLLLLSASVAALAQQTLP